MESSEINENIIDDTYETKDIPQISTYGDDSWWNSSFRFRRLINITNPYADNLTDHIVSLTFNYSVFESEGKMQSDLGDIRIVENDMIRNYFFQIDYPNETLATVWFETNLTDSIEVQQDVYLYYGNESVDIATSSFNVNNRFGLHWWRLDDELGTKAVDSIDNRNGTLLYGPTWIDGRIGGALDFAGPGSNQQMDVTSFSIGDTYIVSAWLKDGANGQMPWGLDRNIGTDLDFWYVQNQVYNNIGDTYGSPFNVPYPADGEWHHFVVANIGGGSSIARIWIDGVFQGTATYHDPTTTNKVFQLSCWPLDNGYHWNGQIDDVRIFDYELSNREVAHITNMSVINTSLNGEQHRGILESLEVTIYDVDGRVVPNAIVSLINTSAVTPILETLNTSEDGSVEFLKIQSGIYNFTIEYQLSNGSKYVAYNSTLSNFGSSDWNKYSFNFTDLYYDIDISVDLWTIDFEIFDWDNDTLGHSYINVSNIQGGYVVDSIELINGQGTFIWKNDTQYYYEVYYNNLDYNDAPLLLNKSYIYRNQYTQYEKYGNYTCLVNQTNLLTGSDYRSQFTLFTNNSASLHKRLIRANVSLLNMNDNLTTVKIYYIDEDGNSPEGNQIYYNDTYNGDQTDIININLREPPKTSQNLIVDDYKAYGLFIDVQGENNTQSNGVINVITTESTLAYNKTAISKIQIKIVDLNDTVVPSTLIYVNKSLVNGGNKFVTLVTNSSGYAHGQSNNGTEFTYLRGETYNFSLSYFGVDDKNFIVNETSDPNQWKPVTFVPLYNFTLYNSSSLIFQMQIDISDFLSVFRNLSYEPSVVWGDTMTFSVNYTISDNEGSSWVGLNDPDEILCDIGGFQVKTMNKASGDGNFTVTFDSSSFSAGGSKETYLVIISGSKLGYISPMPLVFQIEIHAPITSISMHNYSNPAQTITSVSQYYNEMVNITVSYYNTTRLSGATLSYSWDYGSGTEGEDPLNPTYYTFSINTSVVPSVATYQIDIVMSLENYTTKAYTAALTILKRTTAINGSTTLMHISEPLWIQQAQNFTFQYNDTLINASIGDLEEAYYYWYKLDASGNPIGDPSANIDLTQVNTSGKYFYVLDFDTETRAIGDYAIFVTLKKNNYEARNAFIDLEVKLRESTSSLSATNLAESRITVVKGDQITFTLDLTDNSNNDDPLTGATVKITLDNGDVIILTESDTTPGTYTGSYSTTDIDAFFTANTLVGTLSIEKTNYVTRSMEITIVVNMEEIFPGFPMFYFIMIVGGIAAVIGSLTISRAIRSAKIPKFVKKANRIKGTIKSRKEISDSDLYPSKDEFFVKKLEDKWDILGISLRDIMGLEIKKGKTLSEPADKVEKSEGGVIE